MGQNHFVELHFFHETHLNDIQIIAKLSLNFRFSWAERVFNVNLTPPNHPVGKLSGKQDKTIYAKQKLSVLRS